jgi:hypothetical protein
MKRQVFITVTIALTVGCAAPSVPPSAEPTPVPPTALHKISDPSGEMESLVLSRGQIDSLYGPAPIRDLRFEIGAVYAFRGDGSSHNLGLVIEATSDTSLPTFRTDRRLLLEMDGRVFVSPPPSPRLYSVREAGTGITEVIMVPVTPDLLRRFVDASVVRGRLGRWATLEISKDERQRFVELLGEIPEGARFVGEKRRVVQTPVLVTGY